MKVGLLNNLYFPYNRGGAETIVSESAKKFLAHGDELFIISTRPRRKRNQAGEKEAAAIKTRGYSFKLYYLPSRFRDLACLSYGHRFFWHLIDIFNFKKRWQIKKILRQEKPDLIITHNLTGLGFLLPKLLKKMEVKHEHFLHDLQLLHPSGLMIYGQEKKFKSSAAKLYQALTRRLFASPDKVISPSRWLMQEHEDRGFFIKSLREITPFKALSEPHSETVEGKKPGNKNPVFLFVGQMEKHKGIFLLLEAFEKLPNPEASLLMVGVGKQLAAAENMAAKDERVKFLGRQDGADLKSLIAKSRYLIVPSLCYENSPTIIRRAHAQNRPVIASNLGGIPEIVRTGDLLFRPGDEADLLEKLKMASQTIGV